MLYNVLGVGGAGALKNSERNTLCSVVVSMTGNACGVCSEAEVTAVFIAAATEVSAIVGFFSFFVESPTAF